LPTKFPDLLTTRKPMKYPQSYWHPFFN
jgi:hypothetical protein